MGELAGCKITPKIILTGDDKEKIYV